MKYSGYNDSQRGLFSIFFLNWYFQVLRCTTYLFLCLFWIKKKNSEECTETKEHLSKARIIDMGICMAEQHID